MDTCLILNLKLPKQNQNNGFLVLTWSLKKLCKMLLHTNLEIHIYTGGVDRYWVVLDNSVNYRLCHTL